MGSVPLELLVIHSVDPPARIGLEQFEGYQHLLLLDPEALDQRPAWTSEWALRFPSVVGAMLASALVVVLARKLSRSPGRVGERALPCDQSVLRQVVTASARLPVAGGREPRRHPHSPSRARARVALCLGGVRRPRTRCFSSPMQSSGSCSSPHTSCSSCSDVTASCSHGLLAAVVVCRHRRSVGRAARHAHRQRDERDSTDPVPVGRGCDASAPRVFQG